MIYDNKELGKLCNELNINMNQHFILYAVFRKDRSLEEYVIEYKAKNNFAPFSKTEVNDLVEKGYLINSNGVNEIYSKNDGLDIHNFAVNLELTSEFEDKFFMSSQIAGEELFSVYPKFININGNQLPLKKGGEINGKYLDRDGMIKMYATYIGNNQELHNKVINAVLKAKAMGQLNMSLRSFILDKMWFDYFEIEDGSQDNITLL